MSMVSPPVICYNFRYYLFCNYFSSEENKEIKIDNLEKNEENIKSK